METDPSAWTDPDRRPRIGLGCQGLSAVPRDRAVATIHAALDGGVRLLDTADVYAPDDRSLGHNERLVADALAAWSGPADDVVVVTKGGLTRPGGRWRPDGRAKHLQAAAAASAERLGRAHTWMLHAPDDRRFATSLRAMARFAGPVGVCNATVDQLEAAALATELAVVSAELSPAKPAAAYAGVAAWCRARGVPFLAWRPLGGASRARSWATDARARELAEDLGCSAAQAVLGGLCSLGVVPLVGATRPETAAELGRVPALAVSAADLGWTWATRVDGTWLDHAPAPDADGEVLLVMGSPASGKTSIAEVLVDRGYARLNRDDRGGTLRGLLAPLDDLLRSGQRRVVLDNTYPTRAGRAEVVDVAWARGVPVRVWWRDTPRAEAERNAAARILVREGRLLGPAELDRPPRDAPWRIPPRAIVRYHGTLEPPRADEGFADVMRVPFARTHPDGGAATFLADGALTADAVAAADGPVLGLAWDPGDPDGPPVLETRHGVEVAVCPHPGGPPRCWCRPPYPGLVLWLAHRHGLDPRKCTLVGERAWAAVGRLLGMRVVSG